MRQPPYQTFPQISDDRILLRQILKSDIKDIIEISFYDGVQTESKAAHLLFRITFKNLSVTHQNR